MDYYKYQVTNSPEHTEALIGLFSTLPFDTFQENESGFDAYLPASEKAENVSEDIKEFESFFPFKVRSSFIKGENWNQAWESNFKPVLVGNFCGIRADFHDPFSNVKHELVINPKMAFGTGHHETTFSVIQIMEDVEFSGKKVFDYGCGTGILAILASKLDASEIVAVDIEEESYLNTLENCSKNSVDNVQCIHGTLDDVKSKGYGIVLANINRNVILNSLETLAEIIVQEGILVVSGILKVDQELVIKHLTDHQFTVLDVIEKGNWIAMKCQRN